MRDAADFRVLGRFLSRCRTLKQNNKKWFSKAECHFAGLEEMKLLLRLVRFSSRGSDVCVGKSVDERVISSQTAVIGHDVALPVSLSRRSSDTVQSLSDCA